MSSLIPAINNHSSSSVNIHSSTTEHSRKTESNPDTQFTGQTSSPENSRLNNLIVARGAGNPANITLPRIPFRKINTEEQIQEVNNLANVPRSAWNAQAPDPDRLTLRQEPISLVVVSNTQGDPNGVAFTGNPDPAMVKKMVKNKMRQEQAYLMENKNFGDHPNHAVISPFGDVFQGRDARYETAVPKSAPKLKNAYSISLFGDFRTFAEVKKNVYYNPTPWQYHSAARYIAEVLIRLNLSPKHVKFYNEVRPSDAPGGNLDRVELQRLIDSYYTQLRRQLLPQLSISGSALSSTSG